LLGLTALALGRLAGRRDPRAGAVVAATCLAGSVLLTALALCPLPAWWTWQTAAGPAPPAGRSGRPPAETPSACRPATHPARPSDLARGGPGAAYGRLAGWLRDLWRGGGPAAAAGPGPRRYWPAIVAAVFAGGAALGLGRVLRGLWAVRAWRRRSR